MQRLIKFLKEDVWKLQVESLSPVKAFWVKFLRIFLLTTQGFTKSQIQQGASSLTYYSLLSLVPMVTLLIGISRGFLLEANLERWLMNRFSGQTEILMQVITFAKDALQQTQKGVIAGLGVLILFWSAIKILTNIEIVMNEIWEEKRARTLAKKFSDYLAMIVICPFLILVSSSMTVYLSTRLSSINFHTVIFKEIGPILFPLLNLLPYLLICALFTFLYIFIPNTNVRFKPALFAGIIAGIFYQLFQWAYLYFQIGVTAYNAIYGTFAALPLFLIWLHLSWVTFLLGAKMAFAFQNVNAYEFITEDFKLNRMCHQLLCLRLAHLAIRRFCERKEAPSTLDFSHELSIPLVLTHHLLMELVQAGLFNEVQGDEDRETRYQPAFDVNQLTIKRILDMIDERGDSIPLPSTAEVKKILGSLDTFSQLIERSDANIPLKNL